jgi:queuosine precursor transporter
MSYETSLVTTDLCGRRVLWYCIFAQVLVIAILEFVIFYPPSAVMTNNQSYVDVLSAAPRLVLFGTLAMFTGDIANNYVLAKMKVWTNGRHISGRLVVSTLCGQTVNTAVFYIFALTTVRLSNSHIDVTICNAGA